MSKYKLVFSPTAKKELKRLPNWIRERIIEAIDCFAEDPRPHGSLKLEGSQNQYRIRVGDYRVIYSIEDDVLTVPVFVTAKTSTAANRHFFPEKPTHVAHPCFALGRTLQEPRPR